MDWSPVEEKISGAGKTIYNGYDFELIEQSVRILYKENTKE